MSRLVLEKNFMPPPPDLRGRSFMPNGMRAVGGNVVPTPTQVANNAVIDTWTALWSDWLWASEIRPQIDNAAIEGFNGIRVIGNVYSIVNAVYTRAVYHARVKQMADYCASKGMLFYCSALAQDSALAAHTAGKHQEVLDEVEALCAMLSGLPNVLMVDLIQEIDSSSLTYNVAGVQQTWVRNMYLTAKLAAPRLKFTFSMSTCAYASIIDYVDFLDIHYYAGFTPITGGYATNQGAGHASEQVYRISAGLTTLNKPFLVGEFGTRMGTTSPGVPWTDDLRRDFYLFVRDQLHLHPQCMGSFCWAMTDQDTAPDNQFGIYSRATGLRRAYIADVMRTFSARADTPMKLVFARATDHTFGAGASSQALFTADTATFGIPVRLQIDAMAALTTTNADQKVIVRPTVTVAAAVPYEAPSTLPGAFITGTIVGRQQMAGPLLDVIVEREKALSYTVTAKQLAGSSAGAIVKGNADSEYVAELLSPTRVVVRIWPL